MTYLESLQYMENEMPQEQSSINKTRGAKKQIPEFNKSDLLSPYDRMEDCFHDNKIHFINGDIESENMKRTIQWLLYHNLTSQADDVLTIYINSNGGDLYESFALIDMMCASTCKIRTVGIGQIASAAFMIFCSGTKGYRVVGKNTSIMCHQYSSEYGGKHHELKSFLKEGEYCNQRMLDLIKQNSNLEESVIKKKLLNSTDAFLTAGEMISLGLADIIL